MTIVLEGFKYYWSYDPCFRIPSKTRDVTMAIFFRIPSKVNQVIHSPSLVYHLTKFQGCSSYTMGRDASKPVFGVSDKMKFKPSCSATETS